MATLPIQKIWAASPVMAVATLMYIKPESAGEDWSDLDQVSGIDQCR
ncbi:hypothetical protein QA635_13375 [Bradyrhizobium brasilense]|nr:hypothetical protein [Bradyrhizobium australafricanum]WFU35341.1 hypothetical protein QA635_13375 [Bradyrhizobium australafricanum]